MSNHFRMSPSSKMLNDECSISSSTSKQVAIDNMFILRSTHARKGIKSRTFSISPSWTPRLWYFPYWTPRLCYFLTRFLILQQFAPLVPLGTIEYHWFPFGTIWYHWLPLDTIRYHWVPLGTTEYHQVPLGTIQKHT